MNHRLNYSASNVKLVVNTLSLNEPIFGEVTMMLEQTVGIPLSRDNLKEIAERSGRSIISLKIELTDAVANSRIIFIDVPQKEN